jgi:hypothetical protein
MRAARRPRVALTVALAVIAVVAAAASGPIRLSGPRWVFSFGTAHAGHPHGGRFRTPRAAPSSGGGFPLWIAWVVAALVVGFLLFIAIRMLWRWWTERLSGGRDIPSPTVAASGITVRTEPEPEPDAPVVRTGIELALQVLSEEREPADAVIRAWLGLQETAEEAGIRRGAAETATEFTSRILSRVVADDQALRTLLRLYLRARFGDHPVTADDVSAVRGALEELIASWPLSGSPAGAGG